MVRGANWCYGEHGLWGDSSILGLYGNFRYHELELDGAWSGVFFIHKKGGTADISPFLLEIIERAFLLQKLGGDYDWNNF